MATQSNRRKVIDHSALLNLAEQCMANISDDAFNRRKLLPLAERAWLFAKNHIREEEDLMATLSYPATEAHRQEHTLLINNVASLLLHIQASDRFGSIAGAMSLRSWHDNHIVTDKKLLAYIDQNKNKASK